LDPTIQAGVCIFLVTTEAIGKSSSLHHFLLVFVSSLRPSLLLVAIAEGDDEQQRGDGQSEDAHGNGEDDGRLANRWAKCGAANFCVGSTREKGAPSTHFCFSITARPAHRKPKPWTRTEPRRSHAAIARAPAERGQRFRPWPWPILFPCSPLPSYAPLCG
jgi:hypothetical protein